MYYLYTHAYIFYLLHMLFNNNTTAVKSTNHNKNIFNRNLLQIIAYTDL